MHRRLQNHLKRSSQDVHHLPHLGRGVVLRCLVLGVFVALIIAGGWLLQDHIPAIEAWIKASGGKAPLIFILIFVIGITLLIPADILVFAAGALFGVGYGFLYVALGAAIAAPLQFWIAHRFLKGRAESFIERHPTFAAIDQAVSRQGLRIAFLLRLGPVPFSPLSYILGISRISLRDYLLAAPAALPTFLAVVYYGDVAAHLTKLATGLEHGSTLHYAIMIGGMLIAVIATVYITHIARKALKDAGAMG